MAGGKTSLLQVAMPKRATPVDLFRFLNCGIYRILNKVSGKSYIGASRNLKRRKQSHFKRPKNPKLKNAIAKYGKQEFIWMILEYCPDSQLAAIEQFWCDLIKPEYNIRIVCEHNFGLKRTPEQRAKMSVSRMGIKNPRTAPVTEETKQKLRIANLGKKYSPEYRQRLSDIPRTNPLPRRRLLSADQVHEIVRFVKNWNDAETYSEKFNVPRSCISKIAAGKTWSKQTGIITSNLPSDFLVALRKPPPGNKNPIKHSSRALISKSLIQNPNRKKTLDEASVMEIEKLLISGEKAYKIAPKYDVTPGAIYAIRSGDTWSHITGRKNPRGW